MFQQPTRKALVSFMALVMFLSGTFIFQDRLVAQDKEPLDLEQEALGQRYKQFENLLLQLSEHLRKTDPERADLLVRALGKSKHERILSQMEQTGGLIKKGQLGDAIDQQDELVKQLIGLLDLLQSEDRQSELEKEKQRIRDLLKNVNKLISEEKGIRVASGRNADPNQLLEKQKKVEGETRKLHDKIQSQDEKKNPEKSGDDKNGKNKDGENKDGQNKDGENQQGQKGKQSPGEKQQKQSDKNKQGQNQQQNQRQQQNPSGQPGEEQQNQEQQNQEQQTPGREQIKQAQEEMKEARKELEKNQKKESEKHQEEAIAKLQQAKERLEQILRQLRKEEKELRLARLEARFQKMLNAQKQIYDETVNLSGTTRDQWTSRHFGNVRELTSQQAAVILEANKALILLKEEGSSVAFPEAIEQLIDDMKIIASRLEQNEVGEFTQDVEKDVIEAIKELIEAFQKELKDSKSQKQQKSQKGQQQMEQEQSLVQEIAELKMFRSLQMRINRRTKQIGKLIQGEQAGNEDLVDQLQKLSIRQENIQDATYGMATGRNQ